MLSHGAGYGKLGFAGVLGGWDHPNLGACTVLGGPQVQGALADTLSADPCQASRHEESHCAFCFLKVFLKINRNK